jgi:predicted RNA binding protein YcfA (HicA-like mRNA interferase family)
MKYSEIERKLKREGCYSIDESGRHPEWYSPITEVSFLLSHHKSEEAKSGTVHKISKASGVKL